MSRWAKWRKAWRMLRKSPPQPLSQAGGAAAEEALAGAVPSVEATLAAALSCRGAFAGAAGGAVGSCSSVVGAEVGSTSPVARRGAACI